MEETKKYTVTNQLYKGRRLYRAGDEIELTEEEAQRLAEHIGLTGPETSDQSESTDQSDNTRQILLVEENEELKKQLAALQEELRKHQEDMDTLIDEHATALQERDTAIADLTAQLVELKKAPPAQKKK